MDLNVPDSMTPRERAAGAEAPGTAPDPGRGGGSDDGAELTVGDVAALIGVSVRTLHHWDDVGLVRPAARTPAGYRAYSAADVERLQRVLVYRELGFSLSRIAALLDDPTVDETQQLRRQRDLIDERLGRLTRMAEAVDWILAARARGTALTARQQAEIFGGGWREDWADEARDRWGDSDEWAQFETRAAGLSAAERERMRVDGEAVYAALAEAKRAGVDPGGDRAGRLAERHRAMIEQLYDCTHSMHVCLGRMYVDDTRFSAALDALEPGLGDWLRACIDANARAHGVDPELAVWE